MWLRSIFSKWRRLLIILGAICALGVIGFAGWFLWALRAAEDKGGELPFRDDKSLVLQKKSPGGLSYQIDNAHATFRLDIAPTDTNCERLFPSYAAALKFATDAGLPVMPSVQMINGKCKQFNDDLCSALEQAVQTGAARIPGKSQALQTLMQSLLKEREAAPPQARDAIEQAILYVATAVSLGGGSVPLDPGLAAKVDQRKAEFLSNSTQAIPSGFWNENETLRQTFMQDRYLMHGLRLQTDTEACVAMAHVISNDPELSRAFDLFRNFDAKLTNRPVYVPQDVPRAVPANAVSFRDIVASLPEGMLLPDLLAPEALSQTRKKLANTFGSDAGFALCNYATSPEYGLLLEASRNGTLASGQASLELIINAIQHDKISLKPTASSGWYDYQWYALETLLLPERALEARKLTLTKAYKKRLEDAFKSSVAKNRETHIKELPEFLLSQSMTGSQNVPPSKLEIHPEFSAEPTATVYLRTARSYRFLQTALTTVLGDKALRTLRRAPLGNPKGLNLGDELNRMALLCYGIHSIVSTELGLMPTYLQDEISAADLDEAKRIASQWLANAASDPDLARDTRVTVPVIADTSGTHQYWATGGVRMQRVRYDYTREPRVIDVIPIYVSGYYYLPSDVTLEFQRPGILSREEFRRICDSCTDETSLRKLLGVPARAESWNWLRYVGATAGFLLAGIALFLAWRTRKAVPKRVLLGTLAAATLLLGGWVGLMWFDTGYRTRFVVRQIASRSPLLAAFCMNRFLFPYFTGENVPPALVRSLVDLLRDPDPQVRYVAVYYLSYIGAKNLSTIDGAERNLRKIANEPESQLATHALYLLGAFHDDQNIEFLRTKLNDNANDQIVRRMALIGLTETDDPRCIDDILACAHLPDGELRWTAIFLLGNYDDARGLDLIADVLVSGDGKSSQEALSALIDYHLKYKAHYVFGRMDPLLLTAVRNATFSFSHRSRLAAEIHDVTIRIQAYENMLLFPSAQDNKSVTRCQNYAVWRLSCLKSAANTVIPILQKTLDDSKTDPDVRQEIEKAIADLRK